MQTAVPIILVDYVSDTYPFIKGRINGHGSINVYNSKFQLVKSVTGLYDNFLINLDDVITETCFILKAIESGKTESEYSEIIVKRIIQWQKRC